MPIVVCPHCRQPLTAHDSPNAVLVRCAACGQPFTVPAAGSEPWLEMREETRSLRRAARSGPITAFAVVVGLVVMVAAGVYVFGVKEGEGTVAAAAVKEEPKPKPEIRWPEKKPVRKETAKKDVAQPSIERKKWTFDEAYAEAEKMADRLTEPAATETAAALKILTALETSEARSVMALDDDRILFDNDDVRNRLYAMGLTAFVWEKSRKLARKDPDFKATIQTLLTPDCKPSLIVIAMNNWGEIGIFARLMVPRFVGAGQKPFDPMTRDGILLLGGRKWLESLP